MTSNVVDMMCNMFEVTTGMTVTVEGIMYNVLSVKNESRTETLYMPESLYIGNYNLTCLPVTYDGVDYDQTGVFADTIMYNAAGWFNPNTLLYMSDGYNMTSFITIYKDTQLVPILSAENPLLEGSPAHSADIMCALIEDGENTDQTVYVPQLLHDMLSGGGYPMFDNVLVNDGHDVFTFNQNNFSSEVVTPIDFQVGGKVMMVEDPEGEQDAVNLRTLNKKEFIFDPALYATAYSFTPMVTAFGRAMPVSGSVTFKNVFPVGFVGDVKIVVHTAFDEAGLTLDLGYDFALFFYGPSGMTSSSVSTDTVTIDNPATGLYALYKNVTPSIGITSEYNEFISFTISQDLNDVDGDAPSHVGVVSVMLQYV